MSVSYARFKQTLQLSIGIRPATSKALESIIFVDDDELFLNSLKRILGNLTDQRDISFCSDTNEALNLASQSLCTVLVVDWMMPLMDGLQFVRQARKNAEQSQLLLYIIMLSVKNDTHEVAFALNNGADDYVSKPIDATVLTARIQAGLRVLESKLKVREWAIEQKAKAENFLERSLASANDGVILLDENARISFINPTALNWFGQRALDFLGKTIRQAPFPFLHPESATILEKLTIDQFSGGLPRAALEIKMQGPKGQIMHQSFSSATIKNGIGEVLGLIVFLRDISNSALLALKEPSAKAGDQTAASSTLKTPASPDTPTSENLEYREQIRQTSKESDKQAQTALKLESLGMITAGIAHDFNNLLVGIMGHADLALLKMERNTPEILQVIQEHIEKVKGAATQLAELTQQMLSYAGQGPLAVELGNLSQIIEDANQLLDSSFTENVSIHNSLDYELPLIKVDVRQLKQAYVNLVVNATEALEGKKGRIDITTGVITANRDYLATTLLDDNLPEGQYVFFEVADNGRGIHPETLDKIFDPYFSTKFIGRGLGLAAVIGIVRSHKGAIKVTTRQGEGSTFRVLLPSHQQQQLEENDLLLTQTIDDLRSTIDSTILIVDHEPIVRDVAYQMLKRAGYNVLTAYSGENAIEITRSTQKTIAAVLLDASMPGMKSEDALRELRHVHPNLPIIISSGYTEEEIAPHFSKYGRLDFIQKPYFTKALLVKLAKVLKY